MRRISPWVSLPLIVFTLAMLLYPPYLHPRGIPVGHAFIFQPPPYSNINLPELLVKIAIGHLALVLLYITITQIKDSNKIDHVAIAEKTKGAIKSTIDGTLSATFFLLKMVAFIIVAIGILIVSIQIFDGDNTPDASPQQQSLGPNANRPANGYAKSVAPNPFDEFDGQDNTGNPFAVFAKKPQQP